MAGKQNKEDAERFAKLIFSLQSKSEIKEAVKELLEGFVAIDRKPNPLNPRSLSTYLTDFKDHFRGIEHDNPELNEPVANSEIKQCCAYSILVLNPEQERELKARRTKSSQEKSGIKDGKVIDTSKIPKINAGEIIKQSQECLTSSNPAIISCGILNLTGLRVAEQAMPRHEHKKGILIEHKMIVLDEYMIGFRGIVKKRDAEDSLDFYARPTLVRAQEIVDAQEKYLQSVKVQKISTIPRKFSETFYQTIRTEYKKRFGISLSSLPAFDDENYLEKENGAPHKGRSFYACVLRCVLRGGLNKFNAGCCIKIASSSLAQDSDTEVMGYFATFDEDLFDDSPEILLSTDTSKYGKMEIQPVITVKELVKTFNLTNFKDGLEDDESMILAEFLRSEMSETQAILELFKLVRSQKPGSKIGEKSEDSEIPQKPVIKLVEEIVEGIMHYNRQATEGDIKLIAIPSHGLINKISKLRHDTFVAPATVNKYFEQFTDTLDAQLKELGIVDGMKDGKHNGKYFRNSMPELVGKILEYIEPE